MIGGAQGANQEAQGANQEAQDANQEAQVIINEIGTNNGIQGMNNLDQVIGFIGRITQLLNLLQLEPERDEQLDRLLRELYDRRDAIVLEDIQQQIGNTVNGVQGMNVVQVTGFIERLLRIPNQPIIPLIEVLQQRGNALQLEEIEQDIGRAGGVQILNLEQVRGFMGRIRAIGQQELPLFQELGRRENALILHEIQQVIDHAGGVQLLNRAQATQLIQRMFSIGMARIQEQGETLQLYQNLRRRIDTLEFQEIQQEIGQGGVQGINNFELVIRLIQRINTISNRTDEQQQLHQQLILRQNQLMQ